jgi:GNAT superfamily N-acetyltransferase
VTATPDTPGLRSVRAALTPATLLAPGPDHLVLQTAWRQDFHDGNALHAAGTVDVDDLDRWLEAFDERFRHLPGVDHVQVRWETTLDRHHAGAYAERLTAAAEDRGLELERLTVMELAGEPRPLVPLTEGVQVVRAERDEHWWGARALHISDTGGAGEFWTWRVDQLRALARHGRGAVWLAYRFGIPVGTASIWHDDAGVAVVDDVVTHAVHRRLGIASHLVAVACSSHRGPRPDDRLVLLAQHGSDAERLYARLGFVAVGTLWSLGSAGSAPDERR